MNRLRSVGAIALLQALLPLDLLLVGAAVLRRGPRAPRPGPPAGGRRTILVSGGKMTKALVLARLFHAAGHRVVLVETARYRLTGHRFSNAVDAFHVVPDPTSPEYASALLRVVAAEDVDVWVPVSSPASSLPEARAAELLAGRCEVVHLPTDALRRVDDKHAFAEMAEEVGLAVPATHRITDPQQVLDFDFAAHPGPWVLKSIPYDPVRRLDLTPLPRPTPAATAAFVRALPISPDQPWILQELLTGTEWCTHGTARDGRLLVWACCRSSAWQLTYEQVEHPAIRAWVERFVAAHALTGQVSFDFMEDADGSVRAIECNPRTHSAITLLAGRPEVAAAYLDDDADPVQPAAGARPTYWLHHELWQAVRHPSTARSRLRTVRRGTDAVLDGHDPWPFLALHHLHLPSLLLQNLRAGRPWLKIDVNIGKLVEPAGD
ncbi:ATP-grasp enzyme [Nocardioides sp. 1609]|uniref:ATP-grasp enzyme n=1 Tax=Nocardioides sp. 1609 TaxID=2508327 RepID=UPI0010706374|nr:ATP-grasp enzyme [Nocardioides sp. 1609]